MNVFKFLSDFSLRHLLPFLPVTDPDTISFRLDTKYEPVDMSAENPSTGTVLRFGTSGDDTFTGSNGPDTLNGFGGHDIIHGLAGDDFIRGGEGNDTLYGDEGDDTLFGEDGDDSLYGGDGNDNLSGFEGDDSLHGEAGDDTLGGYYGDDQLFGGAGNDRLITGSDIETPTGMDTLDGGLGIDTLVTSFRLLSGRVNGLTGEVLDETGTRILATFSGIENFEADNDVRVDGTNGDNVILATHATGANTLFGHGGNDHIDGGGGDDNINGGDGNDVLIGGLGSDEIDGGAGDDLLRGGEGADILQGGLGINTLDYSDSGSVNVDLLARTAQGGDAQGDIFTQISNIIGGHGNDILTGDQTDNVLDGGNGSNTLSGGDGNDTLISGNGADIIDGGAGFDTVSYERSTAGIHIDQWANTISGGYAQGDTLTDVENIIGSAFDDFIRATSSANVLDGGDGIDTLSYRSTIGVTVNLQTGFTSGGWAQGDTISNFENLIGSSVGDTLTGSDDDNLINGSLGRDFITGGAGADELYGGGDVDDVFYTSSDAAVTVNLDTGIGTGGHAEGDRLDGFENLWGSAHDDILTGSNIANHILGEGGDDIIEGLAGADELNGGTGLNTLSYEHSTSAVNVNLGTRQVSGGHANGDTIFNFINVRGSAFDDLLTGNTDGNLIEAGAGDDTITADAGADTINGGSGDDSLSYAHSTAAISLNFSSGSFTGGHADGDTVTGVENFTGSNFDDIMIGGSEAHDLDGGDGIDTLSYENSTTGVIVLLGAFGTGGDADGDTNRNFEILIGSDFNDSLFGKGGLDETIQGGSGNDVIGGSTGADILSGGLGIDRLDYGSSSEGIIVNLAINSTSGGHAEGDTISGFENLTGSLHNDNLTGDAGANTIFGSNGNDIIIGGLGNDILDGGEGDDILNGGDGSTTTGDGADQIYGGDGNDTINYLGSSTTSSAIDTIDGGNGIDTYRIVNITGHRIVDLTAGNLTLHNGLIRAHLSNIENVEVSGAIEVIGDDNHNIITATSATLKNTLKGGGGNDTIDAGGGDDVIIGGLGKDLLTGGTGKDQFIFDTGDGHDRIYDFEVGTDIIALRGVDPYTSFEDIAALISNHGDYVVVDMGNGDSIRIDGVTIAELTSDHFVFGNDHADGNGPFRSGRVYVDNAVDKSGKKHGKPDHISVLEIMSDDSTPSPSDTFEFKDTTDTTIIADVIDDVEQWDVEGWDMAALRAEFLANLPSSDIIPYVDTNGYIVLLTEDDPMFWYLGI